MMVFHFFFFKFLFYLFVFGFKEYGKKKWVEVHFEGAWIAGVTAGGCRNNIHTFASNPQYLITLTDYDEYDDDDKCSMVIGLLQKIAVLNEEWD